MILAIKFAIAYAIPDIPHWVWQKMAMLEFNRREALKVRQSTQHPVINLNVNMICSMILFCVVQAYGQFA